MRQADIFGQHFNLADLCAFGEVFKVLKTSTIAEQVAAHLRKELELGYWTGLMPGRDKLISELGVNGRTIERALDQLEQEGLLASQGRGKRRRIMIAGTVPTSLPVEILLYEQHDVLNNYVLDLRHQLHSAGHKLTFAPKTLIDLKQDPDLVAKMVKERPGRAWIVQAASRPVLEWFSQFTAPTFALFGIMTGLPMAGGGPDILPALRATLHQLFDLGHRKIVMLVREERRKSGYGAVERVFLEELQQQGIATGAYNLPEWEDHAAGLKQCLDSLFQFTPPTAILIGDPMLYLAVKNYLADQRGPQFRGVALLCMGYDPRFDWCAPPIPHFHWDHRPIVRRIIRWANNVARGKDDRGQGLVQAEFVGAVLIAAVQ